MVNGASHVVQRNPAHILFPAADDSSQPQLKREEQLRQRSTRRTQHDADAQKHDPYPFVHSRLGRLLPDTADFGEKARAKRAVFPQGFRATLAVVADSRSTDQHLRWLRQPRECFAESTGSRDPTVTDSRLPSGRPATTGNILPCQMYDRVHPFETAQILNSGCRVPVNLGDARSRL